MFYFAFINGHRFSQLPHLEQRLHRVKVDNMIWEQKVINCKEAIYDYNQT